MYIIVTLDGRHSRQAPLDGRTPIWVEMKEKGLESVDAENLWKMRINLNPAFPLIEPFLFSASGQSHNQAGSLFAKE